MSQAFSLQIKFRAMNPGALPWAGMNSSFQDEGHAIFVARQDGPDPRTRFQSASGWPRSRVVCVMQLFQSWNRLRGAIFAG